MNEQIFNLHIINDLKKQNMKKNLLLTLFLFGFLVNGFSQNDFHRKIYSVGLGIGNENNISNFGMYFTNDFKYFALDRLAVNPRISFFQSLGLNNYKHYGYKSQSGVFFELGASFSIIKYSYSELSISAGPSFQIGSETYRSLASYDENFEVIEERFSNKYFRRLGLYLDLDFTFNDGDKLEQTIGIKSSYFGIYPEYLGIVYKIGFKL